MKIALAGGGTGGHIMPLVAVARKLKEIRPDIELVYLGPNGAMEKKIIGAEQISQKTVISGKFRRYFSLFNFFDIVKIPVGLMQALWHLLWLMPDAIFSKGGYASLPVVIAGWLYRIPIMIHESDVNPGLANSVLAKFSDRVAVSFEQAQAYFPPDQVVLTGTPLNPKALGGNPEAARAKFSLSADKKTIFIWGGSLGARAINNKILDILPHLIEKYQVIHQTGENNYEEVHAKAGQLGVKVGHEGYFPIPFINEGLNDILALADLVISRAGNTSISEIAAYGKPSIIIPLETAANDHQRMNAYAIAKAGACVVLEESNLGEHMLKKSIDSLMDDSNLREKLAQNIKAFYHPDATEKLANGVLGMIKGSSPISEGDK